MTACYSHERLVEFLSSRSSDGELAKIAAHIECCRACQAALERLSDDDELRSWAKHSLTLPSIDPSVLRRMLDGQERSKGEGNSPGGRPHDRTVDPSAPVAKDGDRQPDPPATGNRFQLIRVFSQGGLGRIWLARDTSLGRDVAIKELQPQKSDHPEHARRFLREAQITGRLEHPNIVPVYELGRRSDDGQPFYVMRRVGGQTFHEAIAEFHRARQVERSSGVKLQKLLGDFLGVCNAISYAHSQGVIHRDLKPDNVLVGDHGEVIVLDWGLAKTGLAGNEADGQFAGQPLFLPGDDGRRTLDGMVLGTPAYMAPEQAAGNGDGIGMLTDIYGLGAILFELLTSRPPHPGADAQESLQHAATAPTPMARSIAKSVPAPLSAICQRAMARAPSSRYPAVRDLIDDVQNYLADAPVSAYRDRLGDHFARWARRYRAAVVATVVSLVIIAGTALAALLVTARALDRAQVAKAAATKSSVLLLAANERNETTLQKEGIAATVRHLRVRDFRLAAQSLKMVPVSRRGWEWFRLRHQVELAPKSLGTLKGAVNQHEWSIISSIVSSDGATLVTAGLDGRVIVWNTQTETGQQPGPGRSFELVRGSWCDYHDVWYSAAFPLRNAPERAADAVVKLDWIDDGTRLAGACLSGRGRIWNLAAPADPPVDVLTHDCPLTAVAADADRSGLLFGSERGELIRARWENGAWHVDAARKGGDGPVMDIVEVDQGRWVVGHAGGEVTLFPSAPTDPQGLKLTPPIWDLDYDAELQRLAVAAGDTVVRTFVVGSAGPFAQPDQYQLSLRTESGSPRPIHAVRFSPAHGQLFAGDDLGRLIAWDLNDSSPALILRDQVHGPVSAERRDAMPEYLCRTYAGIHVLGIGGRVYTTGQNTGVNMWDVSASTGITAFSVGPRPRIMFDHTASEIVWVATGDGSLALWDSRQAKRLGTRQVSDQAVDGFCAAADTPLVATSAGTTVGFWERRGRTIAKARPDIVLPHRVRNVALSPGGHYVAAYDEEDQVLVRNLEKGIGATISMASAAGTTESGEPPAEAVEGCLAFNADGTKLAAAGPGQSVWILAVPSLQLIKKLYLVAGKGGTVLQWHPTDPDTVFAGDTAGRFGARTVSNNQDVRAGGMFSSSVVAIAFTPGADRVAAVSRGGRMRIFDVPRRLGSQLEIQLPRTGPASLPTSAAFDALGKRLAVAHADGVVQIWETGSHSASPRIDSAATPRGRRTWVATTIEEGPQAASISLRHPAVLVDPQDRIWVLYSAVPSEQRQFVKIARQADGRVQTEVLEEIDLTSARSADDIRRAIAVRISGNQLWVVLRRPRPDQGSVLAQIVGLRRPLTGPPASRWTEETLTQESGNFGFDLQLVDGPHEKPAAVHFSWSGFHMYGSYWDGRTWTQQRVGRQGDGFDMHADQSSDGTVHAVFRPRRFGQDRSPSVYMAMTFPSAGARRVDVVAREPLDQLRSVGHMAVLPDDRVVVNLAGTLFQRNASMPNKASGWEMLADTELSSPFAFDAPNGRFLFAHFDAQRHHVLLTTIRGQQATTELVWKAEAPVAGAGQPLVFVDSHGYPVVLAHDPSPKAGWLRVFRTRQPPNGADEVE